MPSRLTFGVEFEFALALLEEGQADPESKLPQPVTILPTSSNPTYYKMSDEVRNAVFDLIATKMVAAGLPTRGLKRYVSPNSSPRSSSDGSSHVQGGGVDDGVGWITPRRHRRAKPPQWHQQAVQDTNDHNDDLIDLGSQPSIVSLDEFGSQWMVTEDVTIAPTRPRDYVWYPIEVQSPPYIFCEDSLQAVRLACKVITSEFRVETNATTGLHVHVGDGANGYTLQTVKKLMAFLWIFEPQLDQLHPNRRARLSENDDRTWYESLRRGSILCGRRSIDGSYPLKVLDGLKFILEADDINDLDDLVRPDHNKSAYQIGHLIYDDTIKRTVEFRQHEGTMHGTRVVEWIKTVVALMEWIMDIETTTLIEFLQEVADFEDRCWPEEEKPAYDIIDLFNDIGLVDQAAYWDQAIPGNTRNKPTKYYQRPRILQKPQSSSESDSSRSAKMPAAPDEENHYLQMLRERGTTTPQNSGSRMISTLWTSYFLGQGHAEEQEEGHAEIREELEKTGTGNGWDTSITHDGLVDEWR